MKFKHIFVCVNQRPPGHPKGCCSDRGGREILMRLVERLQADPTLYSSVVLNSTNCLGPCQAGPVAVFYPEGTWYGRLTTKDADEIFNEHVLNDRIVERLVIGRGFPPKFEV